MNLNGIFTRQKKSTRTVLQKNLDKKLLRHTGLRHLPNWPQLKYIGKFLSSSERNFILSALAIMIIAAVSWLGLFLSRHYQIVPKEGGEYTEGLVGQPKYINPIFSTTNDVDADVSSLVYAGLMHYGKTGELEPDLAASSTLSADNKTYTLTLRQNLLWPDGEPITSDDVVYTYETIQNAEVGSPLLPALQGVKIEKINDLTISFALKEAFAPFANILTTGILPAHLWADIPPSGIKLAKLNSQPLGAGAWKFQKMIKDDSGNIQTITLAHNDNYAGAKPYLKNITFKFFNDYSEAINALRSQSIDGLAFVPHTQREKTEGKNIKLYTFSLPQYTALFLNPEQSANLKDKNVRLALAESLDRQNIINAVLGKDGSIIDSPILPSTLNFDPEAKKIDTDIENANKLLDKNWKRIQPEEYFSLKEAELLKNYQTEIEDIKKTNSTTPEVASTSIEKIGVEVKNTVRQTMEPDQAFYRKDNKNNILQLTITTADSPEYVQIAQIIADSWRKIGVQANIQLASSYEIGRETVKNRNYQVFLYGEIAGADPDPYPFWHSSQVSYPGLNLSMFSDRNADKFLEDGRTTFDKSERIKLYKKFQNILDEEVPAIFLYTPKHLMAINQDIKGIEVDNLINPFDRFKNLNQWYIKTRWQWKK